ncbi:hypothetical protein [Chryseobacterium phocaeense]|uniref:hypothetical protein n=1 Tax=Chryseobacterium phocaeense TaxID=1816690 RepID=UPI0009BB6263|nr:hypothetical protein [Chryseobacterium phocaeense]
MVKKSVLKKLSHTELENYLKEGNRFTPEAVEMAFEILQENGRAFSEQEKIRIQQFIRDKKAGEEAKIQEEVETWKDHITEDPKAIKLFSRNVILVISFILGTIPGSLLLGFNFIKLKKYLAAVLTFILGFAYLPFQHFLVQFMDAGNSYSSSRITRGPEYFAAGAGMVILLVISVLFTPKKLPYRAASYIFPILISVVMIVIIFTFQEVFSSYFLVRLVR